MWHFLLNSYGGYDNISSGVEMLNGRSNTVTNEELTKLTKGLLQDQRKAEGGKTFGKQRKLHLLHHLSKADQIWILPDHPNGEGDVTLQYYRAFTLTLKYLLLKKTSLLLQMLGAIVATKL